MRLAQINRDFRRVFLNNAAWAKFDVYGVRDKSHNYRYDTEDGRYEICGIAAHFFHHLIYSAPHVRRWFLLSTIGPDDRRLAAKLKKKDRYAQLHALALTHRIHDRCCHYKRAVVNYVPRIRLDVWRLWATHPRQPSGRPIEGFETALPAPVAGDKQVVHALLQQDWISSSSRLVRAFDDDRDINMVLAAIYLSHKPSRRLPSDQFLQDAEFVLEALHFAPSDCGKLRLRSIVSHQWHHKAVVLKLVSMNEGLFENLSEELRADREIVLAAVKGSPLNLLSAAETLINDRGFILKALEVQLPVVQASRTERDIVLQAVQVDGSNLEWAPVEFLGDREIVLAAVQKEGSVLEFAAEHLRGDRDIVLAALKSNRNALQYASAELKNDRQVVLYAVSGNGFALEYASDKIKNDRQVVLEAVKNCGDALSYASEVLQNDREVVLEAVKSSRYALQYASEALRADRTIVLAAIREDPWAMDWASTTLRGNREFVFSCLKYLKSLRGKLNWPRQSKIFWDLVSDGLRRDQDFTLQLIVQGVLSLSSVPTDSENYRQLVLAAVQNDTSELRYAPDTLRHNRDFMLRVVKQSPSALHYASQELQDDPEIQAAAQGKRIRESSRG